MSTLGKVQKSTYILNQTAIQVSAAIQNELDKGWQVAQAIPAQDGYVVVYTKERAVVDARLLPNI